MKIMNKFISVLAASVIILSSCTNFVNSEIETGNDVGRETSADVKTSITIGGGVKIENQTSRTALPSLSGIMYVVTATDSAGNKKSTTPSSLSTYSLTLLSGTWTLKADVYKAATEAECVIGNKIFTGSIPAASYTTDTPALDISTEVYNSADTKGNIDLTALVDNTGVTVTAKKIKTCEFAMMNSSEEYVITTTSYTMANLTGQNTVSLQFEDIPTGSYKGIFTFKNTSGTVIFQCTEIINILNKLTTDTWSSTSATGYIKSGKLTVDSTAVTIFAQNDFYVDSEAAVTGVYGTLWDPFKTIQEAFDIVSGYGKASANIYLKKGTETVVTETLTMDVKNMTSLTIGSYGLATAKPVVKQSSTLTASVMKITGKSDGTNNVTISNIVFSGAGATSASDPGVITTSGGALDCQYCVLEVSDCVIKDFYSTDNGGGICYNGTSESQQFHLINTTLDSNTGKNGGGLYIGNGTLICNGAIISKNYARYNGGAIYLPRYGKLSTEAGVEPSLIKENNCTYSSSALHIESGGNTISNFIFQDNGERLTQSDIYISDSNSGIETSVVNTIITGSKGSGVYCDYGKVALGSAAATEIGTKPVIIGTNAAYTTPNAGSGITVGPHGTVTLYKDVVIGNQNASSADGSGNGSYGVATYVDYVNSRWYIGTLKYKGARISGNTDYGIILDCNADISGEMNIVEPLLKKKAAYLRNGSVVSQKETDFSISDTVTLKTGLSKIKIAFGDSSHYKASTQIFTTASSTYLTDINDVFEIDNASPLNTSGLTWTIAESGSNAGYLTSNFGSQIEFYVSSSGDDSNNGTVASPMATIQRAVEVISVLNDTTSTYEIILKDDITNTVHNTEATTSSGADIEITPSDTLKLTIKSDTSGTLRKLIQEEGNYRLFYVDSKAKLTIEDIQINGIKNTAGASGTGYGSLLRVYGGTIDFSGKTTIGSPVTTTVGTVLTSTELSNLSGNNCYALIYLDGSSVLTLKDDSVICGNTIYYSVINLYSSSSVLNIGDAANPAPQIYANNSTNFIIYSNGTVNQYGKIHHCKGNYIYFETSSNTKPTNFYSGSKTYDNETGKILYSKSTGFNMSMNNSYFSNNKNIYNLPEFDLSSSTSITLNGPMDTTSDVLRVEFATGTTITGNQFIKGTDTYNITQSDCDAFTIIQGSDSYYLSLDTTNNRGVITAYTPASDSLSYVIDDVSISMTGNKVNPTFGKILAFTAHKMVSPLPLDISEIATNWNFKVYSDGVDVTSNSTYFTVDTTAHQVSVNAGLPAGQKLQVFVSFTYNGRSYGGSFEVTVDPSATYSFEDVQNSFASLGAGEYTISLDTDMSVNTNVQAVATMLNSNPAAIVNLDLHEADFTIFEADSASPYFDGVTNLKSVMLPSSIRYLSSYAFKNCSGLTGINLPVNLVSIGVGTFEGCTSLKSIAIPSGVETIVNDTFSECTSLETVTIASGVQKIYGFAFNNCTSLKNVVLPDTVTEITRCFMGCTALESITLSNSLEKIGLQTFSGCTALTSVTIPSSVTVIGEKAFQLCSSLTSITFEDTTDDWDVLDSLEKPLSPAVTFTPTADVSANATAVTTTYVDNVLKKKIFVNLSFLDFYLQTLSAGEYNICMTSDMSDVTNVQTLATALKNNEDVIVNLDLSEATFTSFAGGSASLKNVNNLKSVIFPSVLKTIEECAFNQCEGLNSVVIPASVTSIGLYVFYGCKELSSIKVAAGNTVYDSRNDCNAIIETATNTLVYGCVNTTIPSTVTKLGNSCFAGHNLTTISIPSSVTELDEQVFYNCKELTNITIPSSVTSIGRSAFKGCVELTNITIPSSVTSIGITAFTSCEKLTNITIPSSVTSIGSAAFRYCKELTNITIPSSVTSISRYTFSDCEKLTDITIPASVTSIGEGAFNNCTSLTSVTFEDTSSTWEYQSSPVETFTPTADVSANATALTTTYVAKDLIKQ